MTEQIEDEFWAQERARAAAERGRQADPSACGTCRRNVAAGGQVEHDECAQRATLLQAPDHPDWELITGMTEEEVWALPARFHVPVFLDSCTPKAWVCAVCWGDGWNTQWPCKTAHEHGTKVFTPEHQAETTAKKQAAELRSRAARYLTAWRRARTRALAAGSAADRYAAWHRSGQTALQETLEALLVMQMERDEARQELDRTRVNRDYWRDRYRAESRTTWSSEVPPGGEVCADCGEPVESEPCAEHNPTAVAEQMRARVAELESGPALPWAHAMPDDDLGLFLDDLVSAAMGRWRSDPDIPDRQVLADVEKACADWRTPGQGYRSDEPETGERR